MKNRILILARVNAVMIVLLGVLHNIGTFTQQMQSGLTSLPEEVFNRIIYMSLLSGTSFILCGVLLILLFNKVLQYHYLYIFIIVISSYLVLTAIGTSIFMITNPLAWIATFLKVTLFLQALYIGKFLKL
jgi:hypothetical protein